MTEPFTGDNQDLQDMLKQMQRHARVLMAARLRIRRSPSVARYAGSPDQYTSVRQVRLLGNRSGMMEYLDGRVRPVGRHGPTFIACRDGFMFSVMAGPGMYCLPRPAPFGREGEPPRLDSLYHVPVTYLGPYVALDVGFMGGSGPGRAWREYSNDGGSYFLRNHALTFAYVPVKLVYELVERHGGPGNPWGRK